MRKRGMDTSAGVGPVKRKRSTARMTVEMFNFKEEEEGKGNRYEEEEEVVEASPAANRRRVWGSKG